MSYHRFAGLLSEYRRTKSRKFLKIELYGHKRGQNISNFPHRFHNYARQLLSQDTERSDRANRNFILIVEDRNFKERGK